MATMMSAARPAARDAVLERVFDELREQVRRARSQGSGRRVKIEAEVTVDPATGRVVGAFVKPPWIDCADVR
jgi:hypothetical protein